MGALERRCGLEEGYCDEGGAHRCCSTLRRVGDVCASLLAVPLGRGELCVQPLCAARGASFRSNGLRSLRETLRRVLISVVESYAQYGVWLWQSQAGQASHRGRPLGDSYRACSRRRRVLSAGNAFVCRGLVYGLCCFPFSPSSERRATPSLGSLASFKPSHLSHL